MIRKLRIKFVCVVMTIVAVMLAGILGVVVHFTASSMRQQSINMMRAVAGTPLMKDGPGKISEDIRLPFFIVQIGHQGEFIAASSRHFDLSDEADILEIVRAALTSGEESGELEQYNLRFRTEQTPMGYTIVFSDTATERATLRNLLTGCLTVFLAAMGIFLWISILLSHWVIRPVEEAWNRQRQFVADASHELKTPLSIIMANAELLQNEDTREEDRSQFSRNILSVSYQMRSLVDNMLEMARVDNGNVQIQFSPVDFSELVTDAVLSFHLLYEEKGMGLQTSIAEGIHLRGSEQHLYQVLDVLLDNALKYAHPHTDVVVRLEGSGRSCMLSVTNSGNMLSEEELKNIFKRFYRADKARSMNGSYGLGLSIAESIVQAHRGKIRAESKNGQNTFYVQLPTCAHP